MRKHKQPPLDALAKAISTLRDTTAAVAPPASALVNKIRTLRFRGKVAAQAAEALLAKPTKEVEALIPELVAATVKTPLLRWVLDLTRQAADQTGDIRKSLIEAFGKGGRDDLLLTALARRHANDPALLPLISEALGRTGEVVEIAAEILCHFPEGPEARALCDRVASALAEQRTEVRGQLKCLEALARQRSEYFASTLPSVLPRLPDFAYLWLLEGLATARASVAPQREMLLERYRRVHPIHELDAIESLLALGIVDPARSRSGRSGSTARTKARDLVRDLDGSQLQLFLAGVAGRQFSYVRQYARALEEARIPSRYVPGPTKIARYGSAIWERAGTGNRVAVPFVMKIDPADQLDALESWACFALQNIEEYVTLASNPERDACVHILDRILGNLEQLEDAFRSGLLRAARDWLGPEQEEHLDARRDLALLGETSASASELQARQRDLGEGLQFGDPRFRGGWAPLR